MTVGSDNVLSGIYFQDAYMIDNYTRFPEMLLFIDGTHKLNELRMPLYVLLVEDGNGECQIVPLWLVASEDAVTIKTMMLMFKKHNKDWSRTLTIMSDKERGIFLQEFPQANLLICLFHVLRTFRREITSEKWELLLLRDYMCWTYYKECPMQPKKKHILILTGSCSKLGLKPCWIISTITGIKSEMSGS